MPVALARALALAIAVVALLAPTQAFAVDVNADDAGDRYIGSGALLLEHSSARPGADGTRTTPRCPDCRWAALTDCRLLPDGEIVTSISQQCPSLHCPRPDQRIVYAWSSTDGGATWTRHGPICVGPRGPITVEEVETRVQERFEEGVPAGQVSTQPRTGVLPYLPVVFDSGQPAAIAPIRFVIEGREVFIHPVPRWSWDFGDGVTLRTTVPGSRYPDLAVSHAYRRTGHHAVTVRTTWTATYEVSGVGTFDVAQDIVQEAHGSVRVGEGRAVLVR